MFTSLRAGTLCVLQIQFFICSSIYVRLTHRMDRRGLYQHTSTTYSVVLSLCVCMILNFLNHSLFQSRLLRRGVFFIYFSACVWSFPVNVKRTLGRDGGSWGGKVSRHFMKNYSANKYIENVHCRFHSAVLSRQTTLRASDDGDPDSCASFLKLNTCLNV